MRKVSVNNILIISLIIVGMYLLEVRVIVSLVDGTKTYWNQFVDFVMTFRYKQPILFISLPFIFVWLLGKR